MNGGVRLLLDVADMPSLMQKADMAIIVGGGTLWELLYTGCAVLSYSRNSLQAAVLGKLASMGILRYLGDVRKFHGPALISEIRQIASDYTVRKRMAGAGRRLIDGRGTQRIVKRLVAVPQRRHPAVNFCL